VTVRRAAARVVAVLLLPASIVPLFVLGLPAVRVEHASYDARFPHRAPWPAPALALDRAQLARWRPLAPWRGAVPVLVYHGIDDAPDGYSVSQRVFASHMAMLRHAGFRALSMAQYLRFLEGDARGLPARPVLITFDDGRLDSYRGADTILAREGMRATMFVITSQPGRRSPFYVTWDELRAMGRSGRWDLQVHAADGHRLVRVDGAGRTGALYAYREWTGGRLEPFARFRRKVTSDIERARADLAREIPGPRALAFAAPYGDVGHAGTNDPRIPRLMSTWLLARFRAVFVQTDSGYSTPRSPRDGVPRHEVRTGESADALYAWLRAHRPQRARRQS
jgi:peptidoglycan/xylan/chitin deacetylase (PgdA/CDA1 family)